MKPKLVEGAALLKSGLTVDFSEPHRHSETSIVFAYSRMPVY